MSEDKRKVNLNIVVGINGTGKTTWLNNEVVKKSDRCLIITPDRQEWKHIPIISEKDLRTFKGVGKLIYQKDTLKIIENNYFGGVLILDDAMAYLDEITPDSMQYLYIRRRQLGIELYIVAHGLKQLPPKVFTFVSFLILFNSVENFSTRKNLLHPENYNKIIDAQNEIMKKVSSGYPYYYKIILLDHQIKGSYVAAKKNK